MRFSNKVGVVTGGANGIGRCIAEEFLIEGASVAVIDMDEDAGGRLVEDYGQERVLFLAADIAVERSLNLFADKVIKRYGQVDFLINNACISRKGILSRCSYEDFNYVLRVGVSAPYQLSRLFMDIFTENAAIVNISSTRAAMSQADTESYSAAKGGITALTHALSISLAGKVRVNSISPGWIDTTGMDEGISKSDFLQHPVKRIGNPLDIAGMVKFLCSKEGSFINGENITVDGGMSKLMIYHGEQGWNYTPEE
ncbi:SDR family oxidoreductase [Bacillus testis]|uniref:SDR family oxidoreductase n=1 Tax=Bacillus testis TaxID=1622072 RepID=UPI00067F0333|nr:SDR family oxidoreductase [Bacillus testis]